MRGAPRRSIGSASGKPVTGSSGWPRKLAPPRTEPTPRSPRLKRAKAPLGVLTVLKLGVGTLMRTWVTRELSDTRLTVAAAIAAGASRLQHRASSARHEGMLGMVISYGSGFGWWPLPLQLGLGSQP